MINSCVNDVIASIDLTEGKFYADFELYMYVDMNENGTAPAEWTIRDLYDRGKHRCHDPDGAIDPDKSMCCELSANKVQQKL